MLDLDGRPPTNTKCCCRHRRRAYSRVGALEYCRDGSGFRNSCSGSDTHLQLTQLLMGTWGWRSWLIMVSNQIMVCALYSTSLVSETKSAINRQGYYRIQMHLEKRRKDYLPSEKRGMTLTPNKKKKNENNQVFLLLWKIWPVLLWESTHLQDKSVTWVEPML